MFDYELRHPEHADTATIAAFDRVDVIFIDVGDAAMLDTEMSKEDLARMVARGREAAERYLSDM